MVFLHPHPATSLKRKLEGVEKYLAWGKYCQYLEESNAREDVELPFQDEYDDEYDCDDEC